MTAAGLCAYDDGDDPDELAACEGELGPALPRPPLIDRRCIGPDCDVRFRAPPHVHLCPRCRRLVGLLSNRYDP
jgi:hypothetical protein